MYVTVFLSVAKLPMHVSLRFPFHLTVTENPIHLIVTDVCLSDMTIFNLFFNTYHDCFPFI